MGPICYIYIYYCMLTYYYYCYYYYYYYYYLFPKLFDCRGGLGAPILLF